MNLVREYVSCMDELSQIIDLSMQKVEFLEKLNRKFRGAMTKKIEAAIIKIKKDNENLPRLILDLKSSLDVVKYPPIS